MGMGTKPRRTLSLVGKKSELNKLEKPKSKHSPSHCPSIRAEYKSLSNLGLERQSHIQSNFKHRCLLQADTNISSPKLSALMFSHKAAQQKHRGSTIKTSRAAPSDHKGRTNIQATSMASKDKLTAGREDTNSQAASSNSDG
jgi:hypothetical protein